MSDLVKRLRECADPKEADSIEREAADRIEALEAALEKATNNADNLHDCLLYATEWRPIETAPKDGTLILSWNGEWIEIAMWQRPNAINPPMWRGAHCGVSHISQPTHWLPLPQPPGDDHE